MKKIVLLLIVSVFVGSIPDIFGYGLGDAESSTIEIGDKKVKIKTTISPEIIAEQDPQFELKVELLDSVSEELFSNIGYNLKILDNDDTVLFDEKVLASEKSLYVNLKPEETEKLEISSNKDNRGFWISSEEQPIQVSGPIFVTGGIYKIQANILLLENQELETNTLETILIIGEIIPFQIIDDGKEHNLEFISYFDRIENLSFDEKKDSIKAEMKFNWDLEIIDPIPFVHSEVYLPFSLEKFTTHEIDTYVNGFQVFGLVDKSQKDEMIVHFLINNNQLKSLAPQIAESEQNTIIFEVRPGEPIEPIDLNSKHMAKEESMVELSSKSDWKVYWWWEPIGEILPNRNTTFNIMFHDPDTNLMQKNVKYDFTLYQNSEVVYSQIDTQSPSGHDLHDILFSNTGPVLATIGNINNIDTDVEFEFYVGDETGKISIPEWVKNNALWWSEGIIEDSTFASGIEFMIKEKIILVPNTERQQSEESTIPDWVRNNAKWWASNQISDKDFASGLQFLVSSGIISV